MRGSISFGRWGLWSAYATPIILINLVILFATALLTNMALMNRLISIGPLLFNAGALIFPLIFVIADIIAEIYGYKISKLLIYSGLPAVIIFVLVIFLTSYLPAPSYWNNQAAFHTVFGSSLIVDVVSILSTIIGLSVNTRLLTKWKVLLCGKYFWLRSIGSSLIGELVQIIATSMVAFLLIGSDHQVVHIMLSVIFYRFVFSAVMSLPANIVVSILKKAEGNNNVQNYQFNPFMKNPSETSI